jgi:hypothetical protein
MLNARVRLNVQGTNKTIQYIQLIYSRLKDFDEPMEKITKLMKDRVNENWKSEGTVFGNKWKRLAPSTIAHKKHLVKEGSSKINPENVEKILMRSGRMKHSFRYKMKRRGITKKSSHTGTGRTQLDIYNIAPYFAKHQSSNPGDRKITTKGMTKDGKPKKGRPKTVILPRRVMIGMTERIENEIEMIGQRWLDTTVVELEKEKPTDGDEGEWVTL